MSDTALSSISQPLTNQLNYSEAHLVILYTNNDTWRIEVNREAYLYSQKNWSRQNVIAHYIAVKHQYDQSSAAVLRVHTSGQRQTRVTYLSHMQLVPSNVMKS